MSEPPHGVRSLAADEQPVLAADGDGAHGTLGDSGFRDVESDALRITAPQGKRISIALARVVAISTCTNWLLGSSKTLCSDAT